MMKKNVLILIAIFLLASFFRFWRIEEIPPGFYPDVAMYANDALDSLKERNFKVFYPENNGREGLWMWLLAIVFYFFGPSILAVKCSAALVGTVSVVGLFFLVKELFSNIEEKEAERIALFSSFFMAVSFWHTNFSRIGFRAILLPFILIFSFYFFIKGVNCLKKNKKYHYNFILAGIFFGLGFYTYTSFRMAVLVLPFILIPYYFYFKKENLQKKFFLSVVLFLSLAFLIFLPLAFYFFQNPQYFFSRMAPISVFSADNPLKELTKSFILHLGMFNFYGDQNLRHNLPSSPLLFWPVGITFLIGFLISLMKMIKFLNEKNWISFASYSFLISSFFTMLLPGILTQEGIPHALRTIGAIPPIFIFTGLGINFLVKKLKFLKNYSLFFLILFLIIVLFGEYRRYFIVWAKNPETKNAFSSDLVEMGNYLNSLSPETEKYVIVNMGGVPVPYPSGLPMPAQTLIFIEKSKFGKKRTNYLLPTNLDDIKIEKEKIIILPMVFDEEIKKSLKEKFPNGDFQKINNFWIYEIRQ